jgi:hypothetical protein
LQAKQQKRIVATVEVKKYDASGQLIKQEKKAAAPGAPAVWSSIGCVSATVLFCAPVGCSASCLDCGSCHACLRAAKYGSRSWLPNAPSLLRMLLLCS